MLSAEDNERLVRVGPGTAMGNMMRRYWMPVCTSAQLPVPDGRPLRTRLLGQDFVAFRDTEGRVGLLDELCMHRRVSLALGRVENNGIRCLYHGWKYGVDGTIQETPNYASRDYRARFKAPAYPVREAGGLVWAYIGPTEKEPPFPHYRFMDGPPTNRVVLRCDTRVNYLQLYEGGVDSSHVGVLHADHVQINETDKLSEEEDFDLGVMAVDDHAPDLDVVDADYGYYYAAKRAGPPTAEGEETNSIRVTAVIFPTGRIIPAPGSFHYYLLEVPQDDENTATYIICHGLEKADHDAVVEILGLHDARFWNEKDCVFRASWADYMGQDRARMDAGESFAGFSGIEQEDMVLALSMGPIVDRSQEHLVPADRAVVHLRRRLLDSVRRVEEGGDPIGLSVSDYSKVAPLIDTTVPRSARWQDLLPDNAVPTRVAAE
jgi:phthalate 4,5-dioxygenase oxygenase subunit